MLSLQMANTPKNILARKNKALRVINQIMEILGSTFFKIYYFEVVLVLREKSAAVLSYFKP